MSSFIYSIKVLNSECENALIDFPFHDEPHTWINDYELLFNQSLLTLNAPAFEVIQKEDKAFINKLIEFFKAETKKL